MWWRLIGGSSQVVINELCASKWAFASANPCAGLISDRDDEKAQMLILRNSNARPSIAIGFAATDYKPISMPGWSTTIIGGRIRAAGALARPPYRCFLMLSPYQRRRF